MIEVDQIAKSGAEIVAIDATSRPRPDDKNLETFISEIKDKYPNLQIMADISSLEEGINAARMGVNLISTTLCGYTEETKKNTHSRTGQK